MTAKKTNPTKRIVFVIVGLVVLLLIVGVGGRAMGWFGASGGGMMVETAEADIRNVTQRVTASGRVQPEVEVKISPDVSGEIIYLGVKEGQEVEKGSLLIRIKPDFYQAQYEQAKAGVSQARAGLSRAEADLLRVKQELRRAEDLHKRNVIPESEYELAKTNYDIAVANRDAAGFQLESAEAFQREAHENLDKTSIYAPMSGTVSMLNVEFGERVVGTAQMTGTEMLRIAKLNQMEIEAEVNENDVVNISLQDSAHIEIDAYPDRTFRGVVTEIANSARIAAAGSQEQVTNFPVKIRILDPHNGRPDGSESVAIRSSEVVVAADVPEFRPGMSGTVDVFTDFAPDCVTVPIQSVTVRDFNRLDEENDDKGPRDDGDEPEWASSFEEEDLRRVVFTVVDGSASMVEVETGISDEARIQITSGLEGGETVITGPYGAISRTLKDEQKVQVRQ